MSYKDIFSNIYEKRIWTENNPSIPLSGPGSSLESTQEIRPLLDKFIKEKNIHTILDLGCGDLTYISKCQFFNDSDVTYVGVDIVQMLIDNHQKNYPSKLFKCQNIIEFIPEENYDLIIIRDVLFHLRCSDILKILSNLKSKFKYIAMTTNLNEINKDSFDGCHYCQRNLHKSPFFIQNNPVLSYYESKWNRYFNIYEHDSIWKSLSS